MNRREFLFSCASVPFIFPEFKEPLANKDIFPTGLPSLDKILAGGFRPGELCLVLAERAGGKTAFCRSVLRANSGNDCTINELPTGDQDNLIVGQNYNNYFVPDFIRSIPRNEKQPWENRYDMVSGYKQFALENNALMVCTVPIYRPYQGETSYISRPADFMFSLIKRDGKCFLNVVKNRRGDSRLSINIKFSHYNTQAIMEEV